MPAVWKVVRTDLLPPKACTGFTCGGTFADLRTFNTAFRRAPSFGTLAGYLPNPRGSVWARAVTSCGATYIVRYTAPSAPKPTLGWLDLSPTERPSGLPDGVNGAEMKRGRAAQFFGIYLAHSDAIVA